MIPWSHVLWLCGSILSDSIKWTICGNYFVFWMSVHSVHNCILYTTTLPSSHKIVYHSCSITDLHCKPEKHISTFRYTTCFMAVNGNDMCTWKIKYLDFWIRALRTCRKTSPPWLCFYLTYTNLIQAPGHLGMSVFLQRASVSPIVLTERRAPFCLLILLVKDLKNL